jgi:hypothetical protein
MVYGPFNKSHNAFFSVLDVKFILFNFIQNIQKLKTMKYIEYLSKEYI